MTPQDPEVTSNQTKEDIPVISPRLKALVIWQGVAIIIGIVVIFGTLAYRAVNMISDGPEVSTSAPLNAETPSSFAEGILIDTNEIVWGSYTYNAPKGSVYRKLYAQGDIMILEFIHGNGGITLVQISQTSGKRLGDIYIAPAA